MLGNAFLARGDLGEPKLWELIADIFDWALVKICRQLLRGTGRWRYGVVVLLGVVWIRQELCVFEIDVEASEP